MGILSVGLRRVGSGVLDFGLVFWTGFFRLILGLILGFWGLFFLFAGEDGGGRHELVELID